MKHQDILKDLHNLALASRLKRLAERLLADASKIHDECGEPLQPGQFPLIAALDLYGPMTVSDAVTTLGISQPATTRTINEAIKIGLVQSQPSATDKRVRELSLTQQGKNSVARMKLSMWPSVSKAAEQLTRDLPKDFIESLTVLEARLATRPILDRVRENLLTIVPFSDDLAHHFHDINLAWIEEMFTVEPHDKAVLENPRQKIIEKGGRIYFVAKGALDIVGTCALEEEAHGFLELTKMGVIKSAQGQGIGEFLLRKVLEEIRIMGRLDKLFLVSNTRNQAAIHLYEKLGFRHDQNIMGLFGKRYERCDVAMRYVPE